jgi:hypothetical protein
MVWILEKLQKLKKVLIDVIMCDSSTFKLHRQGGKKGQQTKIVSGIVL